MGGVRLFPARMKKRTPGKWRHEMGQVARGFTDRTQLSVSGIHLFGLHAEFDSSGVLALAQNRARVEEWVVR